MVDLIIDHEMSQYDFLIKKKGISKLNKVKESILLLFNLNTTGVAFKSRIHGDFTYRNLRLDGENIFFIDFERSAFDFPEFDLINFILDFDIHNSDSQSYEAYVDYLVDVYIEKKYIKILEKLELNNIFKSKNIDNFHFIYIKYLIRQISIITNVSYYEKSVDIEKIYKSIINRIENHILTNKRIRNDCR